MRIVDFLSCGPSIPLVDPNLRLCSIVFHNHKCEYTTKPILLLPSKKKKSSYYLPKKGKKHFILTDFGYQLI